MLFCFVCVAPVSAASDGSGQIFGGGHLHQDEQHVGGVRQEDPRQAQRTAEGERSSGYVHPHHHPTIHSVIESEAMDS